MTEAVLPHAEAAAKRRFSLLAMPPAVLVLAALLLLLIVPPLVYLVQASFYTTTRTGGFGLFTTRYYEALATSPRFLGEFRDTAIYAAGSAFVAILLGGLQAWIVERTDTPLRRYGFLVAILSLSIPNVLYTIAWLLLLGKSGPLNIGLQFLFSAGRGTVNVSTMPGMILIEGVGYAPLAFFLLSSVFRAADASFEEASMMSGAGIFKTFKNITLKLALPGVLALMLLIFIRAFESFEVPALVGRPGNIRLLTTEIYQSIAKSLPPNYGQAGAFSVALLVFVAIMLAWYGRLSRHAEKFRTITGKGYRPRVMRLGRWRWLTAALLVMLFLLIIGIPLAILLYASLVPFYEGFTALPARLTLAHYQIVWGSASFRESIGNTLILGAGTTTLVVPLTALCAWYAARRKPGGWLLDQLATAPLVFPAIVLGVAFLQLFLSLPFSFYGTLVSIIVAAMVRELPYGMRYAYAGVLQMHPELEEASSASGARQHTTFLRVVMPLIAPALATCWLFVFLNTVRQVAMPILLTGPRSQIVAVTLFELWENGQVTELAAMGISWMVLMTCVSGAFFLVARRYGGLAIR